MMSSNRRTDSRTEISSCLYPSGWASTSRLFASSDFLLACASSRTRPAISAASDKFPSSIFSCMSRNSASASCATSRALRTGSVSFSNRERNSAVRSWASSEPATSATTKTAAQKPRRASKVLPLPVRELASQCSNTCGCLEVHVAVFVLVQFQEFLIRIERQGHLVQFIVTSGANEPASRRRCFLLRQYVQAVQRGGVILAEIFRRHQIFQHVGGLRIHSKRSYQFVHGICVIFFLQVHVPQLRGKVGILRRQRDGLQQHWHSIVILFFAEINQRAQLQHAQRFGRGAGGFIKLGECVIVLARVHQQGSVLQPHGRVVGMRREVNTQFRRGLVVFFLREQSLQQSLMGLIGRNTCRLQRKRLAKSRFGVTRVSGPQQRESQRIANLYACRIESFRSLILFDGRRIFFRGLQRDTQQPLGPRVLWHQFGRALQRRDRRRWIRRDQRHAQVLVGRGHFRIESNRLFILALRVRGFLYCGVGVTQIVMDHGIVRLLGQISLIIQRGAGVILFVHGVLRGGQQTVQFNGGRVLRDFRARSSDDLGKCR